MRLMSKQSTNQWILKTCVTNIFLACLLTTEGWLLVAAKQQPCLARQMDNREDGNCDDASSYYHKPHFTGNRSVIVQLFEWKFLDIAEECRLFLGPQGYAGVQLSPVLEHTLVKSGKLNHPWWERYEVISYRLASRSGDENEFWTMSRICNDHGVRIYADVILNHMAAPLHLLDSAITNKDFIVDTLLEENVNISQLNYPNVSYTQQDFHRSCNIGNTQDAHEIRNCQLNGHPDLDHSHAAVQEHLVEMLNKFIDMGVAGFRIDAAKYIWPIDLKKIFEQVDDLNEDFNFDKNTRPFLYQDVFDLGLDSVSKTEYATYGVVSEYLYPAELATILNGKAPLSSLINWGPAMGFLAHQDSLVFIDSPDTQRGLPLQLGRNYMLTHKQRIKYIMANAFMLAHPYGNIKRIMSSYYFSKKDINQGPPVEEDDELVIRSPQFNEQQQCTIESGWLCEHRWPPLANMMKVANYFRVPGQKEESIIHFQTNGPNQIAFCRGYKLFMAMNNDPELDFTKEVYTCMEPGLYCDIITGGKKAKERGCHGRQLEVNEQGYAQLVLQVADGNDIDMGEEGEEPQMVESYGVLVVYKGSKINPQTEEEIELAESEVEASANDDKGGDGGNADVDIEEANEPSVPDETEGEVEEENNEIENENAEDPEKADNDKNEEANEPSPPDETEGDVEEEDNEIENADDPAKADNDENEEANEPSPPDETEGDVEEEDNEIENAEDPAMVENGESSQQNSKEGDVMIDQPEAENENEVADETPAAAEDEPEVVEVAAEEEETLENDADETENQLEENDENQNEETNEEINEETPAEENPQKEEDAEKPLTQVEEKETTPEESSKEIDSQEENNDEPENIDELEQNPEEQLEKPSAAIVDDLNKETELVQKAGLFSKSSKNGQSKA